MRVNAVKKNPVQTKSTLLGKRFVLGKKPMYLAPIDAIWPPLLLLAMAASIGMVTAYYGVLSLTILVVIGCAILIGDCFGRSKDYLNARRRFVEAANNYETYEVIRRFRRAWCARVACSAAWKREFLRHDMAEAAETYVRDNYYRMGYRWWHIFPDGTFTKNSPFIKLAFWVHLFTGKMKRDQLVRQKQQIEPAE